MNVCGQTIYYCCPATEIETTKDIKDSILVYINILSFSPCCIILFPPFKLFQRNMSTRLASFRETLFSFKKEWWLSYISVNSCIALVAFEQYENWQPMDTLLLSHYFSPTCLCKGLEWIKKKINLEFTVEFSISNKRLLL